MVAEAVGAGSASTVSGSSLKSSLRGLIPAMVLRCTETSALGVVAATCGFGGAAIGYTESEDVAFSLSFSAFPFSLSRVMWRMISSLLNQAL